MHSSLSQLSIEVKAVWALHRRCLLILLTIGIVLEKWLCVLVYVCCRCVTSWITKRCKTWGSSGCCCCKSSLDELDTWAPRGLLGESAESYISIWGSKRLWDSMMTYSIWGIASWLNALSSNYKILLWLWWSWKLEHNRPGCQCCSNFLWGASLKP